jgi:hypothetical protein
MKDMPSRFLRSLAARFALVALPVLASGCYSKATAYDGKFTFAYQSGLDVDNFVKPIAPGAKLDVVAFANGTEDELVITGARSSRPNILAVDSFDEHRVVLKGVEPGTADIEITAKDSAGNVLVDKMFLQVRKPAVHPLEHACTEKKEAAYVSGDRVPIFHGLATSDHRPVIGYAYAPVRVEPAAGLELVAQPQGSSVYMYTAGKPRPKITVRSTIDGSSVSVRIVDRKDLKDASLVCSNDECKTIVGRSQYVVAHVRLGETPLCSQNALTKAHSLTPDICTVTAKLDDDEGTDSNRFQLATITGLKYGVCKYEVTLPELDGGRGVRLAGEAKIGRLQYPGEGESQERLRRRYKMAGIAAGGWFAPKLLVLAFVAMRRRRKAKAQLTSDPAP